MVSVAFPAPVGQTMRENHSSLHGQNLKRVCAFGLIRRLTFAYEAVRLAWDRVEDLHLGITTTIGLSSRTCRFVRDRQLWNLGERIGCLQERRHVASDARCAGCARAAMGIDGFENLKNGSRRRGSRLNRA